MVSFTPLPLVRFAAVCALAALGDLVPSSDVWIADPRIKSVVIAAPAFAFTFTKDGLIRTTL